MSFQHHSEGMSPEFRKLFEDQQSSRQRLQEQIDGSQTALGIGFEVKRRADISSTVLKIVS